MRDFVELVQLQGSQCKPTPPPLDRPEDTRPMCFLLTRVRVPCYAVMWTVRTLDQDLHWARPTNSFPQHMWHILKDSHPSPLSSFVLFIQQAHSLWYVLRCLHIKTQEKLRNPFVWFIRSIRGCHYEVKIPTSQMGIFTFILIFFYVQASTPILDTRTSLEKNKKKREKLTGCRGRKNSNEWMGRCLGRGGPLGARQGGAAMTWFESDHLWQTWENQILPTVCPV